MSPAAASGFGQDNGPATYRGTIRPTAKVPRPSQKTAVLTPRAADRPATSKALVSKPATAKTTGTPAPAVGEITGKATGPLQIIVSLDKQELTLYANGQRIGRTRISSGQRGHVTPTGVFSVIQKSRWHRSNIYDDAPMFFMQRLTWSGIALHQGVVPNYAASHGCIRMPEAFAKNLWALSRMGARVIVAHGDVAPVEITHPRLFEPRREPMVTTKSQIDALAMAPQAWTFAQLTGAAPLASDSPAGLPPLGAPAPDLFKAPSLITKPLKSGPVSVFISRKEGKLFVRKGFEPVFDVPVAIERSGEPMGTHVFTAIAGPDDKSLRWNVVSMTAAQAGAPASAAGALDRVTIPQEAIEQISELVGPGASLIISDQGLGPETGTGTDFIVLTR
jgi:lipoprotein-anchoring transpeptidase ErfK/SrfK